MIIKNIENEIDIFVTILTNRYVFGEDITRNARNEISSQQTSKYKHKKNPEDNLGNVVSTIDTDKIERDVDFISIDETIKCILLNNNWTLEQLFKNEEEIAHLCIHYEYKLQDFISLLMERYPEIVNIQFLKEVVKPFVLLVQKGKSDFEQNKSNSKYRAIFSCI